MREEHMTEMDSLPTLKEALATAHARGASEADIEAIHAFYAPLRSLADVLVRESDAAAAVKSLLGEGEALTLEAQLRQEDREAARRRAAPLRAQADALEAPYEAAVQDVARRRREIAERLDLAQAELVRARTAEQSALFGARPEATA
jgi:hypothetical protein